MRLPLSLIEASKEQFNTLNLVSDIYATKDEKYRANNALQ
jgi:hypothetical protein